MIWLKIYSWLAGAIFLGVSCRAMYVVGAKLLTGDMVEGFDVAVLIFAILFLYVGFKYVQRAIRL